MENSKKLELKRLLEHLRDGEILICTFHIYQNMPDSLQMCCGKVKCGRIYLTYSYIRQHPYHIATLDDEQTMPPSVLSEYTCTGKLGGEDARKHLVHLIEHLTLNKDLINEIPVHDIMIDGVLKAGPPGKIIVHQIPFQLTDPKMFTKLVDDIYEKSGYKKLEASSAWKRPVTDNTNITAADIRELYTQYRPL